MPIPTEESVELLQYLVARLEDLRLANIRALIEEASGAPIVEQIPPEEGSGVPKGVGKTFIRRPTPSESFEIAVDILYHRLVEIPAIAESVSQNLERPAEQIEFRLDTLDQPGPSEPVPLSRMSVAEPERAKILEILRSLGAPTNKNQGRMSWQT